MSPKLRRSRLTLMFGGLCAVIFLVLAINLWLATRPSAVRSRVEALLQEKLDVPFEITSAEFDFSDGVLLRGLRILRPGGEGNIPPVSIIELPRIRIVPDFGALCLGSFNPELVVVEGGRAEVSIGPDGKLNLSELLRKAPSPAGATATESGKPAAPLPDFRVHGFNVSFSDSRKDLAVTATGLELDLNSDTSGGLKVKAGFRLDGAARVEVEGRLAGGLADVSTGPVEATFSVFEFDPMGRFSVLLDEETRKVAQERSFRGRVNLEGAVGFDEKSGLKVRRLQSSLAGCSLVVPGIEQSLVLAGGTVEWTGNMLVVNDARGEISGGKMSLDAKAGLDPAGGSVTTLGGALRLESLPVDEGLLALLVPELTRTYPGIVIRGRAGLTCETAGELKFPPALDAVTATVQLSGFEVNHRELGFPVEKLSGTLSLEKGLVKVGDTLTGKYGAASLAVSQLSYDAAGAGALEAVVELGGEAPADCLPLDSRLRSVLSEKVKGAVTEWDNLQPEGWVALKARVFAEPAKGEEKTRPAPYVLLSVYPRELKIRHKFFPYQVEKISGEALYDSRSPELGVNLDVQGLHGARKIFCKGSFGVQPSSLEGEEKKRPGVDLTITCDNFGYDKALAAALEPEVAELVENLAFKGVFKASVGINSNKSGKPMVRTVLDLVEGEIRPVDFPYLLKLGAGKIVILGSGKVELSGFRTSDSRVVFDGSFAEVDGKPRLDYKLRLTDFEIDRSLPDAFPDRLKKFLTGLGLQGAFSGRLSGWYVKDPQDPANDKVYFEGTEIKTKNAAVDFGVKISEMNASGRFTGGNEKDRPNYFWGEVRVEKARFNRLQLQDGDIVFAFGERHDRIRRLEENAEDAEKTAPYLSSSIIGRLSQGDISETFQMSIASENFYKGRLNGMLYIDTGDKQGDLGGEFAASGVQLSEASVDVFRLGGNGVGGVANGKVFFAGKTGDQDSIRGEGFGSIREAELARLPVFLEIFKIFNIPTLVSLGFSDLVKRSKIDSLDIPYKIEKGRFTTDDLQLKSANSILSFSGSGSMDFNGRLALELEPQLPGSKIKVPILSDIIDLTGIDLEKIVSGIKKGILKIKVSGDVAAPGVDLIAASVVEVPVGPPPGPAKKKDDDKGEEPPPGE